MPPLPQRLPLPVGPFPGRAELVQGKGGVGVAVCEAPTEHGPAMEPPEQKEDVGVARDGLLYAGDETL